MVVPKNLLMAGLPGTLRVLSVLVLEPQPPPACASGMQIEMWIILEHEASVPAGQEHCIGAELLTPNILVHPALLLSPTHTKETRASTHPSGTAFGAPRLLGKAESLFFACSRVWLSLCSHVLAFIEGNVAPPLFSVLCELRHKCHG